ncbi:MAG: ribosomal protein S18-alanine N-acetyltransferase [Clostridium sp.]|nr:ribosomal protein S18-alanine N-acetyltransferase [Clostridium sp.]
MNDLEISPFNEKYIDKILEIEKESFFDPWSKDSMEKELNNSFAKYIIALYKGEVIGYAGMWLILDEGHITNIAVAKKYRGIGAGSLLVEGLIDICKKRYITSMTLEVRKSNTTAHNLYEKYGFCDEGIRKGYYADTKEDAIIMWKREV